MTLLTHVSSSSYANFKFYEKSKSQRISKSDLELKFYARMEIIVFFCFSFLCFQLLFAKSLQIIFV